MLVTTDRPQNCVQPPSSIAWMCDVIPNSLFVSQTWTRQIGDTLTAQSNSLSEFTQDTFL